MTQSNPTIGELKACPFCGTKAKFYGGQSGSGEARGVICYNPTCGCVMNAKEQKLTPVAVIAAAWNARPQSSDAVGGRQCATVIEALELANEALMKLGQGVFYTVESPDQPPSDASGWRISEDEAIKLLSPILGKLHCRMGQGEDRYWHVKNPEDYARATYRALIPTLPSGGER